MCISSPKAPKQPDPSEIIQNQNIANIGAARENTFLSRFNEVTPQGSSYWNIDPETGQYTKSTNLSPMLQRAEDLNQMNQVDTAQNARNLMPYQNANKEALAKGENFLLQRASDELGQPMQQAPDARTGQLYRNMTEAKLADPAGQARNALNNTSQAQGVNSKALQAAGNVVGTDFNYNSLGPAPVANEGTRQSVADSLYNQSASRLDPRFSQEANDLSTQLAAQGITQGSDAYQREMDNFARSKNDAYSSASNIANTESIDAMNKLFGMELAGRQQGVGEANYLRANPLNEAALTGQLDANSSGIASNLLGTQIARESAVPGIGQAYFDLDKSGFDSLLQGRDQVMKELMQVNAMNNPGQYGNANGVGQTSQIPQIGQGGMSQVQGVQAAPVADAMYNDYQGKLNQYQTDVASNNNTMSGVSSIAAAGVMAF